MTSATPGQSHRRPEQPDHRAESVQHDNSTAAALASDWWTIASAGGEAEPSSGSVEPAVATSDMQCLQT